MSTENIELAKTYFNAVAHGDMAALGATFGDELIWRQPGASSVSGVYQGKDAVFGLLGAFMERSGGTFKIDNVEHLMANGDLIAATLTFSASKTGASMKMSGVDIMRVAGGKIVEVWLFSEDQKAEDAFWG